MCTHELQPLQVYKIEKMIFIYVCKSTFSNQKFSAEKKSSIYIVVSYIKSELEKAGGVCCLKSFPNV